MVNPSESNEIYDKFFTIWWPWDVEGVRSRFHRKEPVFIVEYCAALYINPKSENSRGIPVFFWHKTIYAMYDMFFSTCSL